MHRGFRSVIAHLPVIVLAACTSARDPALENARFDRAEAAYISAPGKAVIEGQAFLRDKSGQVNVRYAAGELVRLVPATAYARARFAHYYGGSKFVPAASIPKLDPDPDYAAYTRTTKAGPTGRFTFDHVAPGRYFVTTQLIWKPKEAFLTEGGAIYEEVTVTGKESDVINVVVSGN
jgi:hypothetical protein